MYPMFPSPQFTIPYCGFAWEISSWDPVIHLHKFQGIVTKNSTEPPGLQ